MACWEGPAASKLRQYFVRGKNSRCYSASAISGIAGTITKLPPLAVWRPEDQVVMKLRRLAWTRSNHTDHVANRPSAAVRFRMPMRPATQDNSAAFVADEREVIETR